MAYWHSRRFWDWCATDMTTGHAWLDAVVAAFVAFIVTWLVAFIIHTMKAASDRYWEEKDRVVDLTERITPKISVEV
jgi:threonine/homoserine/homoserine lactone efflux protein